MQDRPDRPSGIGGWLALLVVGMTILGPLLSMAGLNADIMLVENNNPSISSKAQWTSFKHLEWAGVLIFCAISVYGGLRLAMSRTPSAVKTAKVVLWFNYPIAVIVLGMVVPAVALDDFGTFIGSAVPALVVSLIGLSIWTAYLSKSKRVKNTYFASAISGKISPLQNATTSLDGTAYVVGDSNPRLPLVDLAPSHKGSTRTQDHSGTLRRNSLSTHLHGSRTDMVIEDETPDFYEIAWNELSDGSELKGLWAKAFADTEGDENKAKALYIKLRVARLEREYAERRAILQKEYEEKVVEAEQRRLEAEMSRPENIAKRGLLVCSVDTECGAFGVRPSDVIISYNDVDVRDNKALFMRLLETTKPQESVTLQIVQDKEFAHLALRGGRVGIQVAQLA